MYDLILVGGGLANGLLAYRLRQCRPEMRLALLEQGPTLGGNHTWSFFASDLTEAQRLWLAPFIEHRWHSYEVVFPELRRRIASVYESFTSERFHSVLMNHLADAVTTDAPVTSVDPAGVTLEGGVRLDAAAVIDGRGFEPSPHLVLGYQKFTGQVVELAAEHDLSGPILMDATVPQGQGFRFFYTLPLDPHHLLIEDTRYSDAPDLDPEAVSRAIEDYAGGRGWQISRMLRRETGVLPVALAGDIDAFWAEAGATARSGMRAALFHATTGYSLPAAARLADSLAAMPEFPASALRDIVAAHGAAHWRAQGFYRALNRMLFLAGRPDERYRVFQHFYRLPRCLIERFYAGRLTRWDQLRILTGKPPVPFFRALSVLPESAATGG